MCEIEIPTSGNRSQAASTASRFIIGSPMPMKTAWLTSPPRRKCSTWSRISDSVRLRPKLIRPVAQKAQVSGYSRLAREAERAAAVTVAQHHRLQGATIARLEQRLRGPVDRAGLPYQRERAEGDLLGEPPPQIERQVRHLLVGAGASGEPLPHLGAPERGLSGVAQGPLDGEEVHAVQSGSRRAAGQVKDAKPTSVLGFSAHLILVPLTMQAPTGDNARRRMMPTFVIGLREGSRPR